MKPKLLDLFCCQGGAGMGYHRAGFKVIAVDIEPQPRNPFEFYKANAIALLKNLKSGGSFSTGSSSPLYTLDDFSAIHASPPCQAHTNAQKIMGNEHPELIEPTRELLEELGLPYVIENVPGSRIRHPTVQAMRQCGDGQRRPLCDRTTTQEPGDAMTASATLEAPTTPPCACEARTAPHRPRERWRYVGREEHYGYVYDVWVLVANPQGWHVIGSKRGQLVEDAA